MDFDYETERQNIEEIKTYGKEQKVKREKSADNADWVLRKGIRNVTGRRKRIWPKDSKEPETWSGPKTFGIIISGIPGK
jgi:hypothetical protein